jgi:hypothetical protein
MSSVLRKVVHRRVYRDAIAQMLKIARTIPAFTGRALASSFLE